MKLQDLDYDVAVVGAGIAGATLGAILARQGLRVVIYEAKSHPRFAIGESLILETSETLRALAELYDVPELAYFSSEHYFAYIGGSHGVKRHFSFLHHTPGEPQDATHALQAVIPRLPHGHELHLYRQDSDYYLTMVAIHYGATVRQNTPVQEIRFADDRVEIVAAGGDTISAAYLVDAGGFRSLLAQQFDLRSTDLQTHSRAIFTHMVDVPCFHQIGPSPQQYNWPFRASEGTLHHTFDGGWLWVIPFDNHLHATNPLCSVGLMLDPRVHPLRPELRAAEEFHQFVTQFPAVEAQFHRAKPVREWTRTGRIQYTSTRIVGDRWCLLGHAAGFVDPLFSKGLYSSLMSVSMLADLLLDAAQDGDFSAERFHPLEQFTLDYVRQNDRLIANSYKSFADHRLWVVMSVLWLLGAYTEYVKLLSMRVQARSRHDYYAQARQLHLVGGGFPEFDAVAEQVYAEMERVDPRDENEVVRSVREMRALLDAVSWMPEPIRQVLDGRQALPKNKLRLGLFREDAGFLGSGAYRAHFFGDVSQLELVRAFLHESWTYSSPLLNLQRRFDWGRRTHAGEDHGLPGSWLKRLPFSIGQRFDVG